MRIENIDKSFGGLKALDNCSLEIKKGEITAIIGPNGSGKSTLFNIISRLEIQNKGKIFLDNAELTKLKDFEVARKGISRTFQDARLFRNLTIKEHLEIALSDNEKLFSNFFKKREIKEERINEVLEIVGLDKPINTFATDLSYGQQKLLDLAIAIANPHEILMLDEPVAGVNPKLRAQIKKTLKRLNGEGETVLLIEHDMNFVMNLADYIYVLDYGKVIAEGKPSAIKNNMKVLDVYLGD